MQLNTSQSDSYSGVGFKTSESDSNSQDYIALSSPTQVLQLCGFVYILCMSVCPRLFLGTSLSDLLQILTMVRLRKSSNQRVNYQSYILLSFFVVFLVTGAMVCNLGLSCYQRDQLDVLLSYNSCFYKPTSAYARSAKHMDMQACIDLNVP